jgi:imidazolonepropionase-like amidohydrolase
MKIKSLTLFWGLALGLGLASPLCAQQVVIHAGQLIDGVSKSPRRDVSILITNNRIAGVQSGFVTPSETEIIDLRSYTVLPGLIDSHVHITATWHGGDPIRNSVTRSSHDDLIDGVVNAKATLLAGFTTVRDVGGDLRATKALRSAIEAGTIMGPHLFISGNPLGPSNGHGDPLNGLNEELFHPNGDSTVIDSPEEARKAVRILRRQGADLIKIMPSGGVMSIGDDPKHQLMTDDEIKAVIETAHSLGMTVAAHAHGLEAINHTIALGVDSIEHGSYGDSSSWAAYKAHKTYLVPTLLVGDRVYKRAQSNPEQLNPSTVEKALEIGPMLKTMFRHAYKAGVNIAFGTDTFGLSKHGENAQEFAIMVDQGISPMEAIQTATTNAADLLKQSDKLGTITAGRYADIIAVRQDPLIDIRALESIDFVMKVGRVYKRNGKPVE